MEYCVRKGRYEEVKQLVYNAFLWNLNQELKHTQKIIWRIICRKNFDGTVQERLALSKFK